MRQENSPEEITCENITDEITASYAEKGYALTFAEEVMRFDLSQKIPQVIVPSDVSFFTWTSERSHDFFMAYDASFRDRPGFPGWSEEEWVRGTSEYSTFRPELSHLAVVQGHATGFITNEEDDTAPEPTGYLNQVGVDPRWRRQGIGAALVVRSLQGWQEERKVAVMLHVNVNNPGAIRLYQQLGFSIVGRRGKFRKQSA
jgi:ribosomal protein S18 acetylase RimI-like enzyme